MWVKVSDRTRFHLYIWIGAHVLQLYICIGAHDEQTERDAMG